MKIIQRMLKILNEQQKRQSDLAKYLGVNQTVTTNWKLRETDPPAKYIIPICEFLEITPYELLTDEKQDATIPKLSCEEEKVLKAYKLSNDTEKRILDGIFSDILNREENKSKEQGYTA